MRREQPKRKGAVTIEDSTGNDWLPQAKLAHQWFFIEIYDWPRRSERTRGQIRKQHDKASAAREVAISRSSCWFSTWNRISCYLSDQDC